MQIKKDILLSLALVVLTAWLFIAAKTSATPSLNIPTKTCTFPVKCCKNYMPYKPFSPWNFVTEGVLHLTV